MKKVEVVLHDPRWRDAFEAEAKHVPVALGGNVVAIHHIGSTAIPNIYAKPVVDLLVEVRDVTEVDRRSSAMEPLGYEVMGEYGIPGRRYFRKGNQEGVRTHHVHTFEAGSAEVGRHLAFRDYMIAHPGDAQRYSEMKRRLAEEHPRSLDGYVDGKDGFVKEVGRRAARSVFRREFERRRTTHRGRLAGFAATMTRATEEMLAGWDARCARGEAFDVNAEMSAVTLRIVGRTLFGAELAGEADAIRRFALAEAQIVLAAVAQRYRLRLVDAQAIEPDPAVTLRPRRPIMTTLARA